MGLLDINAGHDRGYRPRMTFGVCAGDWYAHGAYIVHQDQNAIVRYTIALYLGFEVFSNGFRTG